MAATSYQEPVAQTPEDRIVVVLDGDQGLPLERDAYPSPDDGADPQPAAHVVDHRPNDRRNDLSGVAPLISVLMPVRNVQQFVVEAVASVLGQTLGDFEVIIVDDASKDDTSVLLASFRDERIRLFRNKHPRGVARSRNQALSHARGHFLAIMDGDDVCEPDRFRRQVQFLHDNPNIGIVGTFGQWIDEASRPIGGISLPEKPFEIAFELYFDCPMINSSVMMPRAVLQAAGGYATNVRYAEPLELWLRLTQSVQIANLAVPLMRVRYHEGRITVRHMSEQTRSANRIRGAAFRAILNREVPDIQIGWWRRAARGEALESEQAVTAVADLLSELVHSFIDEFQLREDEAQLIFERAHIRLTQLMHVHAGQFPNDTLAHLAAARHLETVSQ